MPFVILVIIAVVYTYWDQIVRFLFGLALVAIPLVLVVAFIRNTVRAAREREVQNAY